MNSFGVSEADQNVSVMNAFRFKTNSYGEERSVPHASYQPIVEQTINYIQHAQSKDTEMDETKLHLKEVKVSEVPTAFSADLPNRWVQLSVYNMPIASQKRPLQQKWIQMKFLLQHNFKINRKKIC